MRQFKETAVSQHVGDHGAPPGKKLEVGGNQRQASPPRSDAEGVNSHHRDSCPPKQATREDLRGKRWRKKDAITEFGANSPSTPSKTVAVLN